MHGIALAQAGLIEESLRVLNSLRTEGISSASDKGSVRRLILEGVVKYYQNRSQESVDRTRRALALARAFGYSRIEAEAAVWLAHFSFNFSIYHELASSIAAALDGIDLYEDHTRARICLVIADIAQFVGDRSDASEWYLLSRIFARRDHDHAGMSAIEYNRLAMGLSRLRVEDILGVNDSSSIRRNWLIEISSVEVLHRGLKSEALMELLLVCRSRLYQLSGDFEASLTVLTEIRDSGAGERCGVSEQLLNVELWWCSVLAGRSKERLVGCPPTIDLVEKLEMEEKIEMAYFLSKTPPEYTRHLDPAWINNLLVSTRDHCRLAIDKLHDALVPASSSLLRIRSLAGVDR
jgi:hypothetical protein